MENMDNLAMFALIIGFASPLVIALIEQPTWSKKARTAVTVAFSVLAGAGNAYFAGQFNGTDVTSSVLLVFVASITAYKGLFKPSGLAGKVEAATSPSKPAEQPQGASDGAVEDEEPTQIYVEGPVQG